MDKAKLLELRKKKNDQKRQSDLQKHLELVDAIKDIQKFFEDSLKRDIKQSELLLRKLEEFGEFKKEVAAIKEAIKGIPTVKSVSINNISDLNKLQKTDFTEVKNAILKLVQAADKKTIDSFTINNKKAEEYIPTRRVIEKNGQLVFDDKPMEVTVVGGGGGAIINSSPYVDDTGKSKTVVLDGGAVPVHESTGLIPKVFDTIQIPSYNSNGDPLVVRYRTGGAAGNIVATLTIEYDDVFNITQVVRT